ncbi:hypothetical protein [Dictyobacter arantiisoli]|uniref:Uncharacterized protein n=1 Tax=Dictyobacter arantiisoli TaxID=2014874 RepID=A0A5A5TJL6_9CHLR|nr:hypothetical protein [Dictyobacter arantiisoli]GCF11213.1 hypothetical protein KDI_47770 [Dictyobacter arantiisoli]
MSSNEIFAVHAPEQRIEHWITQLEAQAQLLLSDIDVEEINQKERLALALKIVNQIQRFLTIQQKLEAPAPTSNTVNILLQNLMRRMRGEDEEDLAVDEHEHEHEEEGDVQW